MISKVKFSVAVFLLPLINIFGVSTEVLEENPCEILPPPGTGFVNDPRSCSAYFSCISFLPFEVKCPSPFYFNGNNLCDWPENVACNNCPSTGVHRIAIPESCTRWTLCVNGISLPQECGPGTAFDERIGTCNIAEDVNCGVNTCGKIPGGIGLAPSPDDCNSYFYCFSGLKLSGGMCPPQLLFDTVTSRCVRTGAVCFPGSRRPIKFF